MTQAKSFNEEHRTLWNGGDGEYWVRQQDSMDRTLSPVIEPLLAFAAPRTGSTVIDVGCGCGATTIELAQAVRPGGRVIALDVSEPMLNLARERVQSFGNTECLLGDAAELPLRKFAADLIVSRFVVMFFVDPAAAFSNLRTALSPVGRLRFDCWRTFDDIPWLLVPCQAVYEHAPVFRNPTPKSPAPFPSAIPRV